ncbi:MAG: nucleoside diphosphate kinase regulator [Leptospiraceae bacterium]|nr:nucleoside diphosphate kinase regulator [Leptospiraceae bacterium]MCK6382342.1 nucleoside diphosphate kinase regulator [Leptospiraceae bacterium]NUM40361.1 nucleoside diphosphate kinase regulator [Leptospiraceae bacterium]
MTKRICITENDMKKLKELVNSPTTDSSLRKYQLELEAELKKAKIVKPEEVSSDTITMHSEILLKDMNTEEETTYRIVYPDQSDTEKGYVSILAPIGTALLGYSVGDIIEWKVPGGLAKWKVVKINYQPEASGDFHL